MKNAAWILTLAVVAVADPALLAQQAQAPQRQAPVEIARQAQPVSMTNVRLELTITDQTGGGEPIKKLVSLLLADRGSGRVRSRGTVHAPARAGATNPFNQSYVVELNADANIQRIDGDRVRVMVSVEYAPAAPEGANSEQRGSPLNQTVDVVLANGKPTVIVQAADPLTDRKVTLEATATIVR